MCKEENFEEENISKSPLHSLPSCYTLHVRYILLIISGLVSSKLKYGGHLNWVRYTISIPGAGVETFVRHVEFGCGNKNMGMWAGKN
jgi:hypothetical protein